MAYTSGFTEKIIKKMNPGLASLQPYPFEKLARLKQGLSPPANKSAIDLSIGEPKHKTPDFILDEIKAHLPSTAAYPKTRGQEKLREAITRWLCKRFRLTENSIHPDKHILPVNGTREALFAFAQCIVDHRKSRPVVISPNPFYQIYEGAALLAGAHPVFVNCTAENNFIPDFSSVTADTWNDCQLIYICTPGNPTGAVLDHVTLAKLMDLADKYDFIIASDECYSEIYLDEDHPPIGLLQAAAEAGRDDYRRCIVFHSLSKRSNVPGLRSGFVAGDQELIESFFKYRTYHGCVMPGFTQAASIAAWQDEIHVIQNRKLYREKFAAVLEILAPVMNVYRPEAGFYLWPEVPISDQTFTQQLFSKQNITVLPGSFLSRTANGINPGNNRLRIALVASPEECVEAAVRIRDQIHTLSTGN